eukprot:CAMPEP_0170569430 /NCGR_PEP_ID=MMETSP0224-20130122/542_1 /TAXON_ID=285029 /ORGANISM="Togula jolla, Strain CCCM 725" /LENGTH=116 /DNA_ID=CAMNT_0010891579 /DNA_START=530 /DNA_END=880 /DNA_ORIENTATION=+
MTSAGAKEANEVVPEGSWPTQKLSVRAISGSTSEANTCGPRSHRKISASLSCLSDHGEGSRSLPPAAGFEDEDLASVVGLPMWLGRFQVPDQPHSESPPPHMHAARNLLAALLVPW